MRVARSDMRIVAFLLCYLARPTLASRSEESRRRLFRIASLAPPDRCLTVPSYPGLNRPKRKKAGRFEVGDDVMLNVNILDNSNRIKTRKIITVPGKITEVQPVSAKEATYTVEVAEDDNSEKDNDRPAQLKAGQTFVGNQRDDADRSKASIVRKKLEAVFRPCGKGAEDQMWYRESRGDKTVLRHFVTKATIGAPDRFYGHQSKDHGDILVHPDGIAHELKGYISVEPVFVRDEQRFKGSDEYQIIHFHRDKSRKGTDSDLCLKSGSFGSMPFDKPVWTECLPGGEDSPFALWSLIPAEDNLTDANEDERDDNTHSDYLHSLALHGGLAGMDLLRRFPPWSLLGVHRDADPAEVKAKFRGLSRKLHPDKRMGEADTAGKLDELFLLLQSAYAGLKSKSGAHSFKSEADIEEMLFATSEHVVELLPCMFQRKNKNERYVLDSQGCSREEDITNEGGNIHANNHTFQHANDTHTDDGDDARNTNNQIWLLFLYNPRCGMSRNVSPFLELAAAHLAEINKNNSNDTSYLPIRVGAYGCALHGESLEDSKKSGFMAAFLDPVCKSFGIVATPSTYVVVEAPRDVTHNSTTTEKEAEFLSFYSAPKTGGVRALWPHSLIRFAKQAKDDWIKSSSLIETFVSSDFAINSSFHSTFRVVAFIDPTDLDEKSIQGAVVSSLPRIAQEITDAGGRIGIAACAGSDNDGDAVDCEALGVAWLPNLYVFGANRTMGVSLLSDEFSDRRDVQVSLEALSSTVVAMFGMDAGSAAAFEKEEDVEVESPPGEIPECGADMDEPMPDNDGDNLEIEPTIDEPMPDEPTIDEPTIDEPMIDEPKIDEPKIDEPMIDEPKIDKPKIDEPKRDKPKIDSAPKKPRLADRDTARTINAHDVRTTPQSIGRGSVMGGISGGGSAGAIGN